MKNRSLKTVWIITALLFLFGGVISSQTVARADEMPKDMKKMTLIFATYDSKTADAGVAVTKFMDNIAKRTNNMVKFRKYWSSGMVGPKEIYPAITNGVVHLGYSRTMYYPSKFKLCTIDELPYTGYQMDARQKAYLDLVNEFPELKAEFSGQKLKLLVPLQSTAPNLAIKKPVMSLEDFKNMKIRTGGTGAILIDTWGGVPVNISTPNVYEAVSRGTVEGVFGFPPASMIAYGYHEVAKNFIDTGTGALGMLSFVINQDVYDSFPPVVKKIFEEEVNALGEDYPQVRMAGMRPAIKKALDVGVNIASMPEAEKAKLLKLGSAKLHEKWVAGLVEQGYDEALLRKLISRLSELYDKYAPESNFVDFWALYEKEFKK